MGMTDSQFKAFVRFLLDALADLEKQNLTAEEKQEKLAKIKRNLQQVLED